MAQFARPASDITVNSWTTAPLWSDISETSADDDTTMIQHPKASNTAFEVKLSTVTDPAVGTGHIVRWRSKVKKKEWTYTVALYEATTQIAISGSINQTTANTWEDYTFTLSAGEANSITDYTDLRLRLVMSDIQEITYVTWMELEVPNAGGTDATPVLTALAVTSTFDAVTAIGEVNATTVLTALPATSTFDPVIPVGEVNATTVLTALAVTSTFDPVVVIGEVNATAVLTTLVVTGTFDPTVAVGEVNATTVLTALPVNATFDPIVTSIGVDAPLTSLVVTGTFNAVTTVNDVNATATTMTLLVQGTFDVVTVIGGTTAPLTVLAVQATFDPVVPVGEVNATAVLTALPVTSTFPAVVAVSGTNATVVLTAIGGGGGVRSTRQSPFPAVSALFTAASGGDGLQVTFPAVTVTGEVNATTILTALVVASTFDPVVAVGDTATVESWGMIPI